MNDENKKNERQSVFGMTLKILTTFNLGPAISLMLFALDRKYLEIDIPMWACLLPAILHLGTLLMIGLIGDWLKIDKKS